MKNLFVVLIFFLLAGCATTTMMNHPTKTSIDSDNYECRIEAEQRSANWGAQGNIFMIADWQRECLEHRGWYEVTQ